ncbi:hypothetical protein [Alishewanella jeotgali]|uniref:hypothetical protein n=1 Tax=Alishewanella jeotgali TaxID=545533 RepID=UPI0002F03112|nr:hypothetical protein [Alishewanella jeotgali]
MLKIIFAMLPPSQAAELIPQFYGLSPRNWSAFSAQLYSVFNFASGCGKLQDEILPKVCYVCPITRPDPL